MNYKETLEYLYNAAPAFEKVGAGAYKEGLSNTLALDEHFGHPHKKFKTIHVAGTNGKGSTSHTLAALLQAAGYKVGLYTSPHLVDFNERIRINGEPINHQYVINFVEQERQFFEPLSPSFFELTTALAFKYFADKEVDIAVIEVGLGGRLDCTNIITPILSIITNISFDHTGFLGDTLAQIAAEKAGIIKEGVPVIIGEDNDETRPVFLAKAKEMHAPIFFAQDCQYVTQSIPSDSFGRQYHTRCWGILEGALGGECQEKNVNTILNTLIPLSKAMKATGMPITINGRKPMECLRIALKEVCSMTGLMGRWQKIQESPLVICDTGHNVAGWEYLSKQITETMSIKKKNGGDTHIVFGMVDDKDIESVLKLLPKDAKYYLTQADTHRAINVDKLHKMAKTKGLSGSTYNSVKEAYTAAISNTKKNDFIFVGGSSYVVADFLS
ncbi:MAG: bifunctional folylpolyglutamate synthase/dihydrofolate synthase [Prevotella sp.]|nr:bifunctional folylpolyglutamate synthase/dihydrofolate synthase [Candidatus Prevotella equi]